jgi:hypothetical protein
MKEGKNSCNQGIRSAIYSVANDIGKHDHGSGSNFTQRGKGTRMKSSLPKVLHPLGSRSLVERVLNVSESLHPRRKLVIIGYQGEQVRNTLQHLEDIRICRTKGTVRHWPVLFSS